MKFYPDKQYPDRVKSEGKLIEITPIIENPDGEMTALPPIVYEVPNWQLGFQDSHSVGMPYNIWSNERALIPGSTSNAMHSLRFLIRILEHSPDSDPRKSATMGMDAVRAMLDGLKDYDASRNVR